MITRLWRPGNRVRWQDRIGVFRRELGDSEHAEIVSQIEPTECVSETLPEGLAGGHAGKSTLHYAKEPRGRRKL
jgi:hypothetical protein